MINRLFIIISLLFIEPVFSFAQQSNQVNSPDGQLSISVQISNPVSYSVTFKERPILINSPIQLKTNKLINAPKLQVRKVSVKSIKNSIISPVPEKRKIIPDVYNELTIDFKQPLGLVVRAYNDGVAYRWVSNFEDSVIIENEIASFNFAGKPSAYYPQVVKRQDADSFHTSFEENYMHKALDSISRDALSFTPILVAVPDGPKVLITESDLLDYPGMFIVGSNSSILQARFAPYPLEETISSGEFPQYIVTKRNNFIAYTKGARSYPWRVIAVAAHDKELASNDIVYRLASPSHIQDVSWIKPGKGTDEWIIGINLFNVPFKAGINTATYKYYIDFAKRFGFDRIMMDAGWSDYTDLFKINPALNMEELTTYAKSQGVGISLWTLALTLDRQLDSALKQFNKWGVNFIMTDFIDRDDQKAVNLITRMAEASAQHKIMIMYHGAYKPAGFNRTYPNAITREAVLGSEFNIWSSKVTPDHNLLIPFIRMVSGPLDYEPGLLDNATRKTFRPIEEKVMSQGTRTQQLAMFVVYESPMQIFSGNPSQGMLEPSFMELLGSIPTTWDETIVLDGKVGEYIVTARKHGEIWYIGAMCDWTARTLTVKLDFLNDGDYSFTSCEDGINADRNATDYVIRNSSVIKGDLLTINMAPGGGFMMRIEPPGLK